MPPTLNNPQDLHLNYLEASFLVQLTPAHGIAERCASAVSVQPGAKINGAYYCDHMRKQGLLLDVRGLSNDAFLFQHVMLKQEGIVR